MKNTKIKILIGVTAALVIIAGITTALLLSSKGNKETDDVISLGTEVVTQEKEKTAEKREQVSIFKRRR